MPEFAKTVFEDGENKYDIRTQADGIIHQDVKVVYIGAGGTALSAAEMNKLGDQYAAVVGSANSDLTRLMALMVSEDTRSWVVTDWDADDRETRIEIRDETAAIAVVELAYDDDGRVTEAVVTVGGRVITYSWAYDGDRWTGRTKVVADE